MTAETPKNGFPALDDETRSLLEKGLIDEYLKNKGYDQGRLKKLPEEEARKLMTEAVIYASGKLTEIETKARYKQKIKGIGSSQES
jgi:glutathione S-transferase